MRASDYLTAEGSLARVIDGFKVRENQIDLCDAIDLAVSEESVLVAEAGTGIGKTFAYLIPAVLSGKKTIISTGTRHLQDQLFHSDIPKVIDALDARCKTALLKGRANYVCLHRLDLAPHLEVNNPKTQSMLQQIKEWSLVTGSGDTAELNNIEEDSYIWPVVTSTSENCLGSECDYWDDCFLVKARKKAQDADILVINHYLLLADMTIKEEGFAELLPGASVFVIDEAHQLNEIASHFFGQSLSSRQLYTLVKDTIAEHLKDAADMYDLNTKADELEYAVSDLRLSLGDTGSRQPWALIRNKPAVKAAINKLVEALNDLCDVLELASERGRGLEQCYQRCLLFIDRIHLFSDNNVNNGNSDSSNKIVWYETFPKSFVLHSTPTEVAALFKQYTDDFSASWIFTSATMQVNKSFKHFSNAMGLEDYNEGTWLSPFNYETQSLLYLPTDLPEPSDQLYVKRFIDKVIPVLKQSQGRAFLLFTSYRAMNEAADLLKGEIEYPIMIQGDLPKHELLAQFREIGNAVLLGTSSFWEGVDVRGEALSCVAIDKLPFASPGDPVMQGRLDAIRRMGGQPFMEYQLPQAVIALKQGVGRLIRDVDDSGVVVIGDPRLRTKSYGQLFLNSLPPMPVTYDFEDVKLFYESLSREPDLETACS